MPKNASTDGKDLIKAMRDLEKGLGHISKNFEYVIHPGKHLFLTYVRGIVYGLGALTAVAIVIPLMVSVLHHISWVPIVGDFVQKVVTRIELQQR